MASRTAAADVNPEAHSNELFRVMPAKQKASVKVVADLMGCSIPAAIALQLCREMLRDYCPPDETMAVVAALFGLESKKRAETT